MYRIGQRRKPDPETVDQAIASVPPVDDRAQHEALFRNLDTDALTGLASVGQLGVRLNEMYEHCAALGVRPSNSFALFVMEPDFGHRSPLVRDASRVLIADEISRTFQHGETLAVSGERFIVLAANTPGFSRACTSMVDRLVQIPAVKNADITGWMEPLPDKQVDVSRFVLELAF